MAFEQRPNSGVMFINEQKFAENHPDWRGDLYLDKTFIIEQMNKADGALVKIAISAWKKTVPSTSLSKYAGKDYLSVGAAEPWVKPTEELPY